MRRVILVARAATLIWVAELAEAFDVSRTTVRLSTAAVGVCVLGLGVSLGLTTVASLDGDVPRGIAALMIETAASGALLSAALVTIILALTAPARSTFDHLLCLLPLPSAVRTVGAAAPVTALATIGSVALAVPAMLVSTQVLTASESTRYCCALFLNLILVQALAQAVLHTVGALAESTLRLPAAFASTVSGAVAIGAALLAFGPDVLAPSPLPSGGAPSLTFAGIVGDMAVGRAPLVTSLVCTGSVAVTAASVWGASKLPSTKASPPSVAVLAADRSLRGPRGTLVAHLLVIMRAPQTLLAFTSALGVLAAARWAMPPAVPSEVRHDLVMALPSACCVLVLFGPGRILPWSWTGPAHGRRREWWLAPAGSAHLIVAVVAWALLFSLAVAAGLVDHYRLHDSWVRIALLFSCASLAGVLVPWSDTQPLSGSVGLVVTTMLHLGAMAVVSFVADHSDLMGAAVGILLSSLLVAASVAAAHRLRPLR